MTKVYSGISAFVANNKALSLILVLAALLRFIGVYPGYHPYHSDEGMSYSSAMEMIRSLSLDPGRYDYPSLVPLIHAILYVVFFIPIFILKSIIFSHEDLPTRAQNLIELWQQVVIQNQQTIVLFWGRYVTAAFGVGVVLFTFLVAKKFFSDHRIGLVAAFLTAVNFRQVLNSHLGLPDIYNAFFLLLALYSFSLLIKHPTAKNYLLSGVSIGLSFSAKFQIFILPAFILLHSYIVWDKGGKIVPFLKGFVSPGLLSAAAVSLLVVLLVNPYHLIRWEEFRDETSYVLLKYRLGADNFNLFAISYLYNIGIGKLVSLSIIAGIILGLLKNARNTILLLSVISPFLYVFLYWTGGGYYTRNFVTITPLLLVFAGFFIVRFWDFLMRVKKLRRTGNIMIIISVFIVSWPNIQNSALSSYYFSLPWGFEQARTWARANMPDGARIISHQWDKYPQDKGFELTAWEPQEVYSVSEMREEGVEYAYLNMDWLTLPSTWWMNQTFWERPKDLLRNTYSSITAQELASFSVAKFVKPWQAPDMNFLIVKIPEAERLEKAKRKEKISFSFDSENEWGRWHLTAVAGENKKIVFDPNIGKTNPGSAKIEGGINRFPVFSLMSPAISVFHNRAYKITGWIKNSDYLSKKERDGFLRVDFYRDEPKFNLRDKSLYSSVSSRVFGEPGWYEKEMLVFPPEEARFMTVSIETNNYSEFWFDDIIVYESILEFDNPRSANPYIDYRIPEDVLFPYSQGNL